jgi:uncharacterized membrane protein (DUF485 family)
MQYLRYIAFTDTFPGRLIRHILFWLGQFMFWAIMTAGFFVNPAKSEYLSADLRLHTYFIPDICYTYLVSYYLVDKLLLQENRRRVFAAALVAVTFLTYIIFLLLRLWDYNLFNAPVQMKLQLIWNYSLKFTSLGPPVICAMFLTLKFLKNFHRKSEENEQLIEENTRSQLGQLKAQIHPHFLFNTLSNIHSFAMTKSIIAEQLVSKLSDTMKYMIYECEAAYVDLEKEIRMIEDYIALQSVRYGNALDLRIRITGSTTGKKIAPLFLIPLLENAFKHGTSQVLEYPWIDLDITITDSTISMRLANSKPLIPVDPGFRSGIGLQNVRKRLHLMYHERYRFDTVASEETFVINIEFPLVPVTARTQDATQQSHFVTEPAYE